MGTGDRDRRQASRGGEPYPTGSFVLGLVFGVLGGAGTVAWLFTATEVRWAAGPSLGSAMLILMWVASMMLLRGVLQPVGHALEDQTRAVESGLAATSRELVRLGSIVQTGLDRFERAKVAPPDLGAALPDPPVGSSTTAAFRGASDRGSSATSERAQDGGTAKGLLGRDGDVGAAAPVPTVTFEQTTPALPMERIMEVWDGYRDHGDGYFRAVDFEQRLSRHGLTLRVWAGEQLGLGNRVLAVGYDLDGELVLVPSFTKAPRELEAWFDSEAGIRSPRIQRWHHPARVRYRGGRVEIIERGRIE